MIQFAQITKGKAIIFTGIATSKDLQRPYYTILCSYNSVRREKYKRSEKQVFLKLETCVQTNETACLSTPNKHGIYYKEREIKLDGIDNSQGYIPYIL